MTELAGRKIIKVGDREVTIKELTVAAARGLLLSEEGVPDPLGDHLFQDMRLRDLKVFTSLSDEQLDDMLPTEIEAVISACRGMNKAFFAMADRISERLQKP